MKLGYLALSSFDLEHRLYFRCSKRRLVKSAQSNIKRTINETIRIQIEWRISQVLIAYNYNSRKK